MCAPHFTARHVSTTKFNSFLVRPVPALLYLLCHTDATHFTSRHLHAPSLPSLVMSHAHPFTLDLNPISMICFPYKTLIYLCDILNTYYLLSWSLIINCIPSLQIYPIINKQAFFWLQRDQMRHPFNLCYPNYFTLPLWWPSDVQHAFYTPYGCTIYGYKWAHMGKSIHNAPLV